MAERSAVSAKLVPIDLCATEETIKRRGGEKNVRLARARLTGRMYVARSDAEKKISPANSRGRLRIGGVPLAALDSTVDRCVAQQLELHAPLSFSPPLRVYSSPR